MHPRARPADASQSAVSFPVGAAAAASRSVASSSLRTDMIVTPCVSARTDVIGPQRTLMIDHAAAADHARQLQRIEHGWRTDAFEIFMTRDRAKAVARRADKNRIAGPRHTEAAAENNR